MNPIFILASHSILDASKGFDPGQFIQSILAIVCLAIDSVVYYITSVAFKLYLAISQFELFNTSAFDDMINRTYVVIGVISLFLVAYTLLTAIINPENSSKGNKSFSKIVKNIVIAIVGIAVVPTVFNWFYYFQSVVLCNNTIPKLLLSTVDDSGDTVENTAKEFSALLFESFFYANSTSSVDGEAVDSATAAKELRVKTEDPYNGEYRTLADNQTEDEYSLYNAYENAKNGASFFKAFWPFIFGDWGTNGIIDNSVQYLVILSTIAGGYIAYVMISLCIDMGLRAVKLGYLELIAPLAIMTKVVPDKDSVFKNWSKKTVSCALEVFTRLFIVVFAVYLISMIKNMELISFGSTVCGMKVGFLALLLRALIICSIFAFVKQAPKFFSEATGIKSDGFKIGIMDKFKENGVLQGLGAIGGGVTAGVRNAAITPGLVSGWKNGKNIFSKLGGAAVGAGSWLAATGTGVAKGGSKGWNKAKEAKKWSDVKTSAGSAATETIEETLNKRAKKEEYKSAHGGTTQGVIAGHIADAFKAMKEYPNSYEAKYKYFQNLLKPINETADSGKSMTDAAKSYVSDHEKDIKVTEFEYKDLQGNTIKAKNTQKISLERLKQISEDAEKTANSTGNQIDIDHARLTKNMYEGALKAAQNGALSGKYGANDNGRIDGAIYSKIQAYQSNVRKNRDVILRNSGYEESSSEYAEFAKSLDNIINLDLSDRSKLANFEAFADLLKRKDNGKEVGSFKAASEAKNNISAEANALLDKISEQQDKK